MYIVNTGRDPARGGPAGRDQDWERRLDLLVRRLPQRLQAVVRGLRRPAARWIRIPAGLLLIVASLFSFLPILGLWMLPLGLVLLAEDVPLVRRGADRVLAWIEYRRPHWLGLPYTSHRQPFSSGGPAITNMNASSTRPLGWPDTTLPSILGSGATC